MNPPGGQQVVPVAINQDIINLLKCGICWEYYNLPTVLPCGHTFCLKCIQEIGKHKMNNIHPSKVGMDLSIDCPNCRLQVSLSDIQRMKNGVHVNYVLSSIVEAVLQSKTSSKVDASTSTDQEVGYNNRVNEIQKNLDEIFRVVNKKKSIVNDARGEIDELRSKAMRRRATAETIKRQKQNQANVQGNGTTGSVTWASRLFLPVQYQSEEQNTYDLSDVDPAILSVRTTRTDHMMNNGHFYPLSML